MKNAVLVVACAVLLGAAGCDVQLGAMPRFTKSPIDLIDLADRRHYRLVPDARLRGEVSIAETRLLEEREEQDCPTCTVHVTRRERAEPLLKAIHADLAFSDEGVWVLGHAAPAATEATLHHFPLTDRPGDGRSWRLVDLATQPRSLVLRDDVVLVATERDFFWFARPFLSADDCALGTAGVASPERRADKRR